MRFEVETTSAVPIYAQIVAQVKQAMAAGVLRAGESLPSLRELASSLRVNPLTVARAYRELEAAGLVTTEHGRGTFVSAQAVALGDAARQELLAAAVDRLLVEAYHLGATPDAVRATLEERLQARRAEEEASHV